MSDPVKERFGNYYIELRREEYYADLKVWEIAGVTTEGEMLFGEDFTTVRPENPTIDGSIKWDGCSNWDFGTDECMMHFCGVAGAVEFGKLIPKLYEMVADAMPEHAENMK